jgi:alpha-beta hydrolase superfamily lysophospholipase
MSSLPASAPAARFVSPLYDDGFLAQRSRPHLPLLLYLPGFDGTLVAPFLQLPMLSEEYDIEGLSIGMADRSRFSELMSLVEARLLAEPSGRKLYVMGESFGGILATSVALALHRAGRPLAGLVLVNPATSYLESELAARAPAVAALPPVAYVFGVLSLLPLFTDKFQLPQLLKLTSGSKLPLVIQTPAAEAYLGRVAFTIASRLKWMPRATLRWRLEEWLAVGARYVRSVEDELRALHLPTCIVVGEADATLPSVAESERLAQILPNVSCTIVPGAGHASTCGSRVNLAAVFRAKFGLQAHAHHFPAAPVWQPDPVDFGLYDRRHAVVQPYDYWRYVTARGTDAEPSDSVRQDSLEASHDP